MTIPPFDDQGNLPPGIHFCTWDEFIARFDTTAKRSRLIEGLKKAMEHFRAAGCRTIYINGSFVTDKLNPNDFDACWDAEGVDIDYLRMNAPTLLNLYDQRAAQKSKYRGEFFPSELLADDTGLTFLELFQFDKRKNRKGIIAIDLLRWEP
ncbi:MAG: hypothetical protein RIG63_07040 [Coleofasciculus chthonoplastes F3-SA18-01]|uniref:DUF6932 family protein n=1 Tax=Coleofasciculus chthonoplastes TaxID=64178 RepID=UPI0032F71483